MRKSVALLLGFVVFFAAGAAGYLVATSQHREGVPAVDPPTDVTEVAFSLPDLDGVVHDSSEWQGKARLINFWATWCAPCRREIPLLKDTQEHYGADGIQVIGIAVDFADDVKTYAEDAGFNYPVLVGQEDAMAVAEKSGIEFIGLPFTLLVAPSGELITAHIGEILPAHMERIVDVLTSLNAGRMNVAAAREALGDL